MKKLPCRFINGLQIISNSIFFIRWRENLKKCYASNIRIHIHHKLRFSFTFTFFNILDNLKKGDSPVFLISSKNNENTLTREIKTLRYFIRRNHRFCVPNNITCWRFETLTNHNHISSQICARTTGFAFKPTSKYENILFPIHNLCLDLNAAVVTLFFSSYSNFVSIFELCKFSMGLVTFLNHFRL